VLSTILAARQGQITVIKSLSLIFAMDICRVVSFALREGQNSSGAVFSLSAPSPPDRCRNLRRGGSMLASSPPLSLDPAVFALEG